MDFDGNIMTPLNNKFGCREIYNIINDRGESAWDDENLITDEMVNNLKKSIDAEREPYLRPLVTLWIENCMVFESGRRIYQISVKEGTYVYYRYYNFV